MKSILYEQALTKQGVSFTYMERLDLEAIDVNAGLRNQARLMNPVDEELIDQYTQMEKGGSEAPAIVVYKRKNRNIWIPMDGNQRIAAKKKAGRKTTDAYVVESTDQMVLDRITWSFNNQVNGKRLTEEESLEHAITMVQKYGLDVKGAAKEWGVKWWLVKKKLTANKVRSVLRSRNAGHAVDMTDDKMEELHPLLPLGEDILTIAATTTYRCGLACSDIKELKKEVSAAKTHDDKLKAVAEFAESDLAKQRRAETKGGTIKATQRNLLPSERLFKQLKGVLYMLETFDKAALRRQGVHYKEMHELVVDVTDRLILTFGLGGRTKQEVG